MKLADQTKWQCCLSMRCTAPSADPERLGYLQDIDTLRKLLSHLPFGRLVPQPIKAGAACLAFAHVAGFATQQKVLTRRCEEIDHLGIFAEPCLVLRTSRNDHNVAGAADPLFAAEAELHFALLSIHTICSFAWLCGST
jgi:hypothetical protein